MCWCLGICVLACLGACVCGYLCECLLLVMLPLLCRCAALAISSVRLVSRLFRFLFDFYLLLFWLKACSPFTAPGPLRPVGPLSQLEGTH